MVEIVSGIGDVALAVIAALLAYRQLSPAERSADAAIDQARTARDIHVAETFQRAVENLNDDRLTTRLGAVITLRNLRTNFPEFRSSVEDLLTEHLRDSGSVYGDNSPPADIQAIIEALTTNEREKRAWWRTQRRF